MHKGVFHAILPKDAKDIRCTIEVFKKKPERHRSKPRTVSFQGREDDVVMMVVDVVPKYVVPARC